MSRYPDDLSDVRCVVADLLGQLGGKAKIAAKDALRMAKKLRDDAAAKKAQAVADGKAIAAKKKAGATDPEEGEGVASRRGARRGRRAEGVAELLSAAVGCREG